MTGGGSRTGCGSEWSRCCLRGRRIRWAFTQLVAGLTALGRSPRTLPGDCRDQSVNLRGEHDLGLVAIGRSAAQSDCGGTCRSRRTLVSPRARSAPLASAPTRIRQRPEYHHAPVVVCANALGSAEHQQRYVGLGLTPRPRAWCVRLPTPVRSTSALGRLDLSQLARANVQPCRCANSHRSHAVHPSPLIRESFACCGTAPGRGS
jgi:hypothetical protein